jgi:hypothetical protein
MCAVSFLIKNLLVLEPVGYALTIQNSILHPIPRYYIQSPLSKLQPPISVSITVQIGG